MYPTWKALHIVAVVVWFAGLFYIVRLFVYLREVQDRPPEVRAVLEPELRLMASRLWLGITWPGALATLGFGLALLGIFWPPPPWLQLKLALVAGLTAYHLVCHSVYRRLQRGEPVWSGTRLRVWNEVATLFLVSIVFLVVFKDAMSVVWGGLGVTVFAAALMAGIVAYRRIRLRAASAPSTAPEPDRR